MIDICSLGAVGDGRTDNTDVLQKAIDKAAETQMTLYVPEGVFLTGSLHFHPRVGMVGSPVWSYSDSGGSVLRLNSETATCLIDITGATGVTLNGLCLDGRNLGTGIHGILANNLQYSPKESLRKHSHVDNSGAAIEGESGIRIERCRIGHFSGDGMRLERIWAFHIRNCMSISNAGNGVWVRGWDGFLLDNCLSLNGEAGYGAYEENASITMTGNRIEWNRAGGIICQGGAHYNITGNYIDRSGGPGIWFRPRGGVNSTVVSAVANVIYRSGKPDWCPHDEYASAHARFDNVHGLVFSGNSMNAGKDDKGLGQFSPQYGIVYTGLANSIIKDNVMHLGVLKELLVNRGMNGAEVIVKDNVGSVFVPGQTPERELNASFADPEWVRRDEQDGTAGATSPEVERG